MKIKLAVILFCTFLFQSCSKSDSNSAEIINTPFQPVTTNNIVMYEINPAAFSPSKDFQGIINRLDNIKALGVNTIWIMPIFPVGEVNSFGSFYCIKDYTSVRTSLGSMQDFKNLVTTAHQKGIAVILDWVANHTSWDHSWITSNSSWYTHDENGQIISPAGTGWNDVADLNFNNQDMRLAMIDAMKFWVTETNIDGFRCDAADYVPADFWQQANTALNAIPNKQLILLAEGARADHFNSGFQLNFSWDYLGTIKNVFGNNQQSVGSIFTTNSAENNVVPIGKQKLRFTTNHDESNQNSPITLYGGKNGALAASVITIFLQGVPLLYCGQEVGISSPSTYNGSNTINWNLNSDMELAYKNILTFYNSSAASKTGIITNYSTSDCAVFKKSLGSEEVLVVVNSRLLSKNFTVPAAIQGNWINALSGQAYILNSTLSLNGYQYLILKK